MQKKQRSTNHYNNNNNKQQEQRVIRKTSSQVDRDEWEGHDIHPDLTRRKKKNPKSNWYLKTEVEILGVARVLFVNFRIG